jgi:carbon monoxide dehydrogenase subunit G
VPPEAEVITMASLSKEIVSRATPDAVWDAIRDIGALHTRLVPGFVTATELIPGGRRVTFGNGMVVDEPIIDSDDQRRRLAWTATGDALPLRHYNAAVQVFPHEQGSRIVWTADLLPDEAAPTVGGMMDQGMAAMERTLDRLATAARNPSR